MKSYKLNISGVVQGVGFRYFCYRKAIEYKVFGYVKNLFNGSVEVMAQGEDGLIKEFIYELKIGPRYSSVKSVITEEIETEKEYSEFLIY